MPSKERNYGIDVFRLATGFFVITAHAGRFEPFPVYVHDAVSLMGKWSVPFFFMVLGFFLGRSEDKNRAMPALMRIAVMFFIASLLMIPLDYLLDREVTLRLVPKTFLLNGTHFHLWFLSSLVMGLLVIRITDEYEIKWLLPTCAVVALVASIWLGTYDRNESSDFGRHLTSIPYLYVGTLLAKRTLPLQVSIGLLVLGIGIGIVEILISHERGRDFWVCPALVAGMPLTLGMFGISRSIPNTPTVMRLGRLGERFAGCIFITHVYFMWVVSNVAEHLGIDNSVAYCVLVVPIIFSLNLSTLLLIDRVAPICIDVLRAEKAALQRVGNAISALPSAIATRFGAATVARPVGQPPDSG